MDTESFLKAMGDFAKSMKVYKIDGLCATPKADFGLSRVMNIVPLYMPGATGILEKKSLTKRANKVKTAGDHLLKYEAVVNSVVFGREDPEGDSLAKSNSAIGKLVQRVLVNVCQVRVFQKQKKVVKMRFGMMKEFTKQMLVPNLAELHFVCDLGSNISRAPNFLSILETPIPPFNYAVTNAIISRDVNDQVEIETLCQALEYSMVRSQDEEESQDEEDDIADYMDMD